MDMSLLGSVVRYDDDRAMYQQIADQLRHLISDGRLAPGQRLPPETGLQDHYGVARLTVRAAIKVLRQDGLVVSEQGRGVFVCAAPPPPPPPPPLPRDRWVGASPGGNVTPGGKALEALDEIRALAQRYDLVLRVQVEEIVAAVHLDF